jgi:hypothetical protein
MPEEIIFTHETELTENNLTVYNLPKSLQMNVFNFNRAKEKYAQMPEGDEKTNQLNSLKKKSIILADAIQTFIERELPDEIENPNPNNMNEELIKRAKAVGLPETATEQEVIDAETKLASTQALAERAKAVGLAETATEEEIVAAEKAKTPPADADEAAKKAKQEEEAKAAAEAKKKEEEEKKPKKFDVMTAFDIL